MKLYKGKAVKPYKWNKESLGNVSAKKDAALEQLNYWDSLERLGSLSEEDRRSQRTARDEFSHCAILEEISWRQKSRALWLKEGDNNTKFFHRMANARRRGNFISSLTVRGVRMDKEEELKEGIRSYFKSMFEETPVRRPAVDSGLFKTLDLLDNETLEGPFSKEEVFEDLHTQNTVFRSLNATFLVLIPKKAGASDVQDFRLISLVGRLYKIIAKVLANRLKRVMGKVVSNSQNAFVGVFSSLIARAEEKGFIRGFKVMGRSGEGIYVSHLLFADDTLLFCEDNRDQLEFWKRKIQEEIGYLEKQYLSKEARLTLIKSTLSNLPIYFMSLFVIPKKVRLRLERIQREFLWGDLEERRKIHLRFPLERESFWRKVIVGKFGEEEGGWTIRKWLTFEGDKEVEAGVGRFKKGRIPKFGRSRGRESLMSNHIIAVWGKFLTVDMLMKRGWSMVNRCSLCKDNKESADHILIHCDKTRELWTLLLSSFGLV
ncbi:hypothetical protein CK203_004994 [Vitis vinifera]|uniref:Reverse transcriptase zinc-binding domain-containing protein n=1 Tax=Vitis vinifera TaxID=29760 RepID=A0A438KE92_VITVI|nr:hypothetical protein CK203_004994 [Vitis vinifera]